MKDIQKWTVQIERSLYNELKHMSFDEGQSINEFCKPAIDVFRSELVKLRDTVSTTRQKQIEDAKLASQYPMSVSGHVEDLIENEDNLDDNTEP